MHSVAREFTKFNLVQRFHVYQRACFASHQELLLLAIVHTRGSLIVYSTCSFPGEQLPTLGK